MEITEKVLKDLGFKKIESAKYYYLRIFGYEFFLEQSGDIHNYTFKLTLDSPGHSVSSIEELFGFIAIDFDGYMEEYKDKIKNLFELD